LCCDLGGKRVAAFCWSVNSSCRTRGQPAHTHTHTHTHTHSLTYTNTPATQPSHTCVFVMMI
jgi:hypothetical protein